MSESLLKKEFSSGDLNRIRNIVKKDYSNKTKIQTGYRKQIADREEGEMWEEDGRTWTVRNGLKKTVPKHTGIKNKIKIPFTCPRCKGSMHHHLSKKMFKIHGFCFNCTVEYESQLRKAGLYSQYENKMIKGGLKSFSKDLEQWVVESLDNVDSNTFITESGDIEDWRSNRQTIKKKSLEELQDFLKYVNGYLAT